MSKGTRPVNGMNISYESWEQRSQSHRTVLGTVLATVLLLSGLTLACSLKSEPADSLADTIIEESQRLGNAKDPIVIAYKFEDPGQHTIVLCPDKPINDSDFAGTLSDVDLTLLRKLHEGRKKGAGTLAVFVDNRWSSVDYLTDHVDVDSAIVSVKKAGETVDIRVAPSTPRPRIVSLQ